jgi:diamine N-acetyltransferase
MPKQVIHPIEKGRIRLRLLEGSDLPMTLRWRNQDHIRKWFVHPEVISPQQHQEWFECYLERDNDYVFIIEETRDFLKSVGQISLYNIEWNHKRAEYGRLMIGEPDAEHKGIAKDASSLLLYYAFRGLGLDRVELEVFSNNQPAIAIYRACGFSEVSDSNGIMKMINTISA